MFVPEIKIYPIIIIFFLFIPLSIIAQSNKIIDEILATEEIDLFQTAYLLSFAAGKSPETEAPEAFIEVLVAETDYFSEMGPDYILNAAEFSLALMEMFDLGGGVMFSIFHSPRYAFRELVSKGILGKRTDYSYLLAGETALNIIQKALKWKEEFVY